MNHAFKLHDLDLDFETKVSRDFFEMRQDKRLVSARYLANNDYELIFFNKLVVKSPVIRYNLIMRSLPFNIKGINNNN